MDIANGKGVNAITTSADAKWTLISRDLAGIRLEEGRFQEEVFEDCDLTKGKFKGVTFELCRFSKGQWSECTFTQCRFVGCVFEEISTSFINFIDCLFACCQFKHVSIEGGSFENSLIAGTKISHIDLYWTNLMNVTVIDTVCQNSAFANPMVDMMTLIRVDLRSSQMKADNLGTTGDCSGVRRVDVLGCGAESKQKRKK